MRKLAIFAGGYAAAVAASVLLFPDLNRFSAGAVCAGVAVLLALLRRVLPDRVRRRALLCCVGMAFGMLWTEGYDRLFVEPVRQLDDTTMILTAVVTDWPEETEYGIKVRTRAQLPRGGHTDAFLYLDAEYARVQPGDRVTTVAHCTFSDKNGLGQSVSYDTAKGVFLLATAYGEAEIVRPERMPLSTVPAQAIRKLQQGIGNAFPGRTQTLIRAIVTGDRQQLEPLMVSGLNRTGLTHTVAVSGMHLAFLAGLLNLLLGRGKRVTALIGIPVILLFVLMIGCPPSAVRAAVMLILLQLAPLLKREGDTPTSLLLALLLLLAHNPFAAADIGLQLSFGAVAGIVLFAQRLQDRFTAWMTPARGLKGLLYSVIRAVAAIVSVTLGAQVFTLPLTAYYFNIISLISPLANVLCMWAVCALFVLGALGGCLGALVPGAAAVFGLPAVPVGEYFYRVVTALAQFPYASIPARPELYLLWMGFVYVVLVLAFLLPGRKRLTVPWASASITLAAAILCTTAALRDLPMQVDVLDVGQGQSVLLRCEDRFALVDCGGDSYYDPGDVAADRLCSYGCTTLDLLIISHYHDDHANGVPELLDRIDVKRIALPDTQPDSELRQRILSAARQKDIEVFFVTEDTTLALAGGAITIYPPLGGEDANELGLTVLYSVGQEDILITGDMNAECEQMLLAHAQLPDVEVMVAGHHGSKHSNSEALLEAVRPEIAVISVGAYNRFGHPTAEAMERFEAAGATIYRTDERGTVSLTADPK